MKYLQPLFDSDQAIVARLAGHGFEATLPRVLVLQLLASGARHQTTDELCAAMYRSRLRCGISTLRMTVYELANAGVLTRVTTCAEGALHRVNYYEIAEAPHFHLFCVRCQRLDEVADDALSDLERTALRRRGLAPTRTVSAALHGLCADCLSAQH